MIDFDREALERELRGESVRPHSRNGGTVPSPQTERLRRVLAKLVKKRMEALVLFRPLPVGAAFHACSARWRLADGSNRSGKTLSAAVEYARAHLGCDPYDKFPRYNGNSLVVGLSADHLSQTMWRKLSEPGAFKIIQDEHSGKWRAVRPNPDNPVELDPYDLAYKEKWRDAPPLIPPHLVEVKYEDFGKREPRLIRFRTTGWRSLWRSAGGSANPPQGDVYHYGWIDEHIGNELFQSEMARGFVDVHGKGVCSACPEHANPYLIELRDRALAGDPRVQRFTFLIMDNPYIDADEKQAFYDDLPNEDARRVKFHGEYGAVGRRVYDRLFDPQGLHGCEPRAIPENYSRYAAVDPGRQWAGTLLAAVDPDEKYVEVYDAYMLEGGVNAMIWARALKERHGGHQLEAIVMDQRMGRQVAVGAKDDRTTAQHYWEALKLVDFLPRRQGPMAGFFPGSDDILGREEALLSWMTVREIGPFAGTAILQIHRGKMPELERQIRRAQYDHKTGTKRVKFPGCDELVQCAEYLAAFRPGYVEPPRRTTHSKAWTDHLLAIQAEQRRRNTSGVVLG